MSRCNISREKATLGFLGERGRHLLVPRTYIKSLDDCIRVLRLVLRLLLQLLSRLLTSTVPYFVNEERMSGREVRNMAVSSWCQYNMYPLFNADCRCQHESPRLRERFEARPICRRVYR